MILFITAWVSDKNYFQCTISIMFTCSEQFLLPNIKQKSKLKCFLLLKKASPGAELGHALLSHWVNYYIVSAMILTSSSPKETFKMCFFFMQITVQIILGMTLLSEALYWHQKYVQRQRPIPQQSTHQCQGIRAFIQPTVNPVEHKSKQSIKFFYQTLQHQNTLDGIL